MYIDLASGKTTGEALAHNGIGVLTGMGLGALATALNAPAILALIATVVAIAAYDFVYDRNLFGVKDGIDYIGGKIDWLIKQGKRYDWTTQMNSYKQMPNWNYWRWNYLHR